MGKQTLFYKDKPLFGLDIGHDALRVMQTHRHKNEKPQVTAYGDTSFDANALKEGVVADQNIITTALDKLLKNHLAGRLTTNRVVLGIPAYRTYSRSLQLPLLQGDELAEAVRLEAEQYIPVPLQQLYLDYTVTGSRTDGCDVYMIAVPQTLADGYIAVAEAVGLEVIAIETTTAAQARLFSLDPDSSKATALVDFGNLSGSISLYDKANLVTGTMPVGGKAFTDAIAEALKLDHDKAESLKTTHGLMKSKYQEDILKAVAPRLDQVISEIRRTQRYYEERFGDEHQISQVVVLGGGSGMPGLSEHLTEALALPARTINPWDSLEHANVGMPGPSRRPVYAAVAGLSLISPREVFND